MERAIDDRCSNLPPRPAVKGTWLISMLEGPTGSREYGMMSCVPFSLGADPTRRLEVFHELSCFIWLPVEAGTSMLCLLSGSEPPPNFNPSPGDPSER